MLNEREEAGFRSILSRISDEDIFSLADTVTKKQVVLNNREEAVRAILSYSESSSELLRRKKLKRDLLFQYADENKITVAISAEKLQIVKEILKFWGSSTNPNNNPTFDDEEDEVQSSVSPAVQININCMSVLGNVSGHTVGAAHLQPQSPHVSFSLGIPQPQATVHNQTTPETDSQTLALAFVDWFFKMLNSQNQTAGLEPMDFGPHHFWSDVKFHLVAHTTADSMEDLITGSQMVVQRLLGLVQQEMLLFNPNVSRDGVRGRSDPHGLVMVEVCGTLHRYSDCLGMFRQAFGLIRDPSHDNNWKIKLSKLYIQSGQPVAMPHLEPGDLCKDLLALT